VITPDTVDQLELVHTLRGHTDRVYGLRFSSDGRLLASGGQDGTIRVWEVVSRREIQVLKGDGSWDVFFAPHDGHVASTRGTIWDIATGEEVRSFAR
jgi:WD40 repeat protein